MQKAKTEWIKENSEQKKNISKRKRKQDSACLLLSEKISKQIYFITEKQFKQHTLFRWKNLSPLFYAEY